MSFTSIGTAGSAVEVLAPTLKPPQQFCNAISSAVLTGRRSVAPHFVFFLPTPESYIVLHISFANVVTFRSYVETVVTFSTFALCYGYELIGFALWYYRTRYYALLGG
jgi:hypothetical protein